MHSDQTCFMTGLTYDQIMILTNHICVRRPVVLRGVIGLTHRNSDFSIKYGCTNLTCNFMAESNTYIKKDEKFDVLVNSGYKSMYRHNYIKCMAVMLHFVNTPVLFSLTDVCWEINQS